MTGWLTSHQIRRLKVLGKNYLILRAEQLIETVAETVGNAQTKTHCDPICDVKFEVIIDTIGGVEQED